MTRRRIHGSLRTAAILTRAGVVRLERPDKLVRVAVTMLRWGPTPAAGYHISTMRTPQRVRRSTTTAAAITFAELDAATNALAHGLRGLGVREGDSIAIFCRDHRGFIDVSVAASKLGASLLLLNTSFAAPPDRGGLRGARTRAF